MTGELITVVLIFFSLMAIRVPVAISMAFASVVGLMMANLNPINAVTQLYRGLDVFVLLAVPFFLLLGLLVTHSSIGTRILEISAFMTARLRGGVGHMNVIVGVLMSGLSGSATADAAGVGSFLIPMMKKRGYSAAYAAALTAIVSTLAAVIPPSIIMVIYGAYAGVSIGALFIGGIIPGFVCAALFMVINYFHARKRNIDFGGSVEKTQEIMGELVAIETSGQATLAVAPAPVAVAPPRFFRLLYRAFPALLVPVILRGGVGLGYFTATEAGVVAVAYVLVLIAVIYREINFGKLRDILEEAFRFYSLPLIAAGMATVLAFVLTFMGGADLVRDAVVKSDLPAFGYLLLIVGIFIVVGMFLDAFPAIVLFMPIFIPGATALGIHPIQLGLVVVVTLALGLVTPPFGLCMLITSKIAGASVVATTKALLPFCGAMLAVVILMVASPEATMWLPKLVYPDLFQ